MGCSCVGLGNLKDSWGETEVQTLLDMLASFSSRYGTLKFPQKSEQYNQVEYSNSLDWCDACISSLFRSTVAVQRFSEMERPENHEDRYLIIWGVLQAIVIQQDSIKNLYKIFSLKSLGFKNYPTTMALRELRNATGGHPTEVNRQSSSLVFDITGNDWGVKMIYENNLLDMHPTILNCLRSYEEELLKMFTLIWEYAQNHS